MMFFITRLKNRVIAKVINSFPALAKGFIEAYKPWESEGIPWTPVVKPLAKSTVAIVTTAGVHRKDQKSFNMHDKNGDPSFREIDSNTPVRDLMITHDYYDHTDAGKDLNIVFPIERLQEFASEGIIGKIADAQYTFMGHIIGPHIYTLMEVSVPEVAARLKKKEVDYVLLTPGWAICNQSVGLIQRGIEAAGIPTIGISIVRQYTEKVKPPRTIFLKWPFGHPLGEPNHIDQQRAVLHKAFEALMEIKTPGTIIDVPWQWKREIYK